MNLHAIVGIWIIVAILGLSATGITWSQFAGNNVNSVVTAMDWKATPINTELPGARAAFEGPRGEADRAQEPGGAASSQVERVVEVARQQGLSGELVLRPPREVNTAWQASERWVSWRLTSDAISVDGATGEVVDTQNFFDLPLFSKLSAWGIYLHMGIMFGLPLQIALCLVGIAIAVVTIQGYRMWWRRRPTRPQRAAEAAGPVRFAGVPGVPTRFDRDVVGVYCFALVFALTVGVILPTVGCSLAVFMLIDVALIVRARRRRTSLQPVA